ncbi:MAG: hypothetical protein JJ975_09265 [Bacteroidia bacterium]|nr:hypothetical protein [Bacteroidia bacterium]
MDQLKHLWLFSLSSVFLLFGCMDGGCIGFTHRITGVSHVSALERQGFSEDFKSYSQPVPYKFLTYRIYFTSENDSSSSSCSGPSGELSPFHNHVDSIEVFDNGVDVSDKFGVTGLFFDVPLDSLFCLEPFKMNQTPFYFQLGYRDAPMQTDTTELTFKIHVSKDIGSHTIKAPEVIVTP